MSAPVAEPTKRSRIALVGAGVIGTHHGLVMSELADRVELVAVVDVSADKAEKLAAERGGRAFTSLTEALAAVDVDIVVVCTPTGRHGELAIEALEAGKHVIIEKPAETTVAKTDQIIEAQRKAGTLVAVISQHRFDQSTEIALNAIAKGELGRLTTGIASIDWWRGQSYYDSGDWRGTWELDGGGALMNQGVHTVDLLVATMGRPVEVFAYTGTLAHERIEVEDAAVAVVRFESGALGVLHATTAAYPGLSARLQVHGDRGSIVIDNDVLTFIHVTPTGSEAEEKLMGRIEFAQPGRRLPRGRTVRTRPPAAIPEASPRWLTAASTRTSWLRWPARSRFGSIWRPTGSRSPSSPACTSPPGPESPWPSDRDPFVGNERSRELLSLCAGCNVRKAPGTNVHVRFRRSGCRPHRGAEPGLRRFSAPPSSFRDISWLITHQYRWMMNHELDGRIVTNSPCRNSARWGKIPQ